MLQNKLHMFVDSFTEALVLASRMCFSTLAAKWLYFSFLNWMQLKNDRCKLEEFAKEPFSNERKY